ncbi:MAG: response regulator [Candidatus Saliniplasma sp.]
MLIAEDESTVRKSLKMTLERAEEFSAEIDTASDGQKALEKVENKEYDLILSDHKMPGMTGVELLKKAREISPDTLRILITGYRDLSIAKQAINKANVHEYIEKPWENEELRSVINEHLKRKEQRESEDIKEVDNVKEALKTIKDSQEQLASAKGFHKEIVAFEFKTSQEFNKFSSKLKNMDNVNIEDIDIFENKYIVRLAYYPSSYGKIK